MSTARKRQRKPSPIQLSKEFVSQVLNISSSAFHDVKLQSGVQKDGLFCVVITGNVPNMPPWMATR
jgi:hypothetical protein